MRRRISIAVAAAGTSALLALTGAMAMAKAKASGGSTLKCSLSLATEAPAGSAAVPQPAPNGSQYGPVRCAKAGFGAGLAGNHFTVPDSGDLVVPTRSTSRPEASTGSSISSRRTVGSRPPRSRA